MNNHQIYQLRHVELDPRVVAKIWPFVNAYRPHDSAPTWREFKADGIDRIEEESLMDILEDHYFETHGYYPDEHPAIIGAESEGGAKHRPVCEANYYER